MNVGKTFKGLTDIEFAQITERLKHIIIIEEHNRVIVLPKIVVEVLYNEIQRNSKYKNQMSLRFARISRIGMIKTLMKPTQLIELGKYMKDSFG